jgi:hypothetical protein
MSTSKKERSKMKKFPRLPMKKTARRSSMTAVTNSKRALMTSTILRNTTSEPTHTAISPIKRGKTPSVQ